MQNKKKDSNSDNCEQLHTKIMIIIWISRWIIQVILMKNYLKIYLFIILLIVNIIFDWKCLLSHLIKQK